MTHAMKYIYICRNIIISQVLEPLGRLKISASEDGLTSNLLIHDAAKSDSGNYTCEGYNSAGHTNRGFLPILINYSGTSGLKNGSDSTPLSVWTIPLLLLLLVFT